MAAEKGTSPGDKRRTEAPETKAEVRGAKPGVTIDLEAQPSSESEQPVDETGTSGAVTAGGGEPSGDAGDAGQPASDDTGGGAEGSAPTSVASEPSGERRGFLPLALAGIVGGIVALAIGLGLQVAGLIPAPGQIEAQQALAEAEGIKDSVLVFDQRLTSIEAASAQSIADRALIDDLSRRVGVVDALGESLSDRLLITEAAIAELKDDTGDDASAEMQKALDSFSERMTSLESKPVPEPDNRVQKVLDSLSERVTRLETAPATATPAIGETPVAADEAPAEAEAASTTPAPLVATQPAPADEAENRTAALAALRLAATAGGVFSAELAAIGKLGIAPDAIEKLEPLADKGVPSRADLLDQFSAVADAILATEPAGEDGAGFLARLAAYGRSLVKVRPSGAPAEDAPANILARMQRAVADGDLQTALGEREALPEEGQAASQAWAAAVADRLEIDKLADEIAAAAGDTE